MKALGLGANSVTYNAVVDVCCKCGDLTRAEATVNLMRSNGQMPDSTTLNMLLHACCKLKQHERLFHFLELMQKLQVKPNATTMSTLAANFTGDWQRLERRLSSM